MNYREIQELFRQFDNSWKVFSSLGKNTIVWKDWNGKFHYGTSIEELRKQLQKAPLCQNEFYQMEV